MDKHRQRHKLTATRCVTLDSFVNQICDFEHASLIEKRLYIQSDYVYSEYTLYLNIFKWFFFLSYGTLADFVKSIDCSVFWQDCCFGMPAVTVKFVILSTLAR